MAEESNTGWGKRNPEDQIHSFSPTLAKKFSLAGAVVLGYLAFAINAKKVLTEGKKRWSMTLDAMSEQYPYLGRTTIDESLKKLGTAKVIEISSHNKKGYDRTRDYAITDPEALKLARTEHIYFSKQDAVDYGVVGAVLLRNLKYWINENRKKDPNYCQHKMSSSELAKVLPFTKHQIKGALARLVECEVLNKQQMRGRDRTNFYSLANPETLDASAQNRICTSENPNAIIAKADDLSAKMDIHSANLDMHRANRDNNTILEDTIEREPLEDTVSRQHDVESANTTTLSFPNETGEKSSDDPQTKSPLQTLMEKVKAYDVSEEEKRIFVRTFAQNAHWETRGDLVQFFNLAEIAYCSDDNFKQILVNGPNNMVAWTEAEVLFKFLSLKDNQLFCAIWELAHQEQYWHPGFADPKDCDVLDACVTLILVDSFKLYLEYACESRVHQSFECLQNLLPKLELFYGLHNETLKADKLDHLKSFMQKRQENFASRFKHLENDPNQHPAQKAHILLNGLEAINKIGVYENGAISNKIFTVPTSAISAAKKLFEVNVELTPRPIISLMSLCTEIGKCPAPADGDRDPLFYVRRGNDLGFLLRNLNSIVQHEAVSGIDLPISEYLPPEVMFGPKHG